MWSVPCLVTGRALGAKLEAYLGVLAASEGILLEMTRLGDTVTIIKLPENWEEMVSSFVTWKPRDAPRDAARCLYMVLIQLPKGGCCRLPPRFAPGVGPVVPPTHPESKSPP